MIYFDKPLSLLATDQETYPESHIFNARQMFDAMANQNPSAAFSLYWITLRRESYRQALKAHPNSSQKRAAYLKNLFPYGVSLYRNPTRFLRWYLSRNHGCLLGDPTGGYFIPVNTYESEFLKSPHPNPNALADNFTLAILKYLRKLPKVRYTRKETGYGFVEFRLPPYCHLNEKGLSVKTAKTSKVRLTGYLTEWEIEQFLKSELRKYLSLFHESIDPLYLNLIKREVSGVNY